MMQKQKLNAIKLNGGLSMSDKLYYFLIVFIVLMTATLILGGIIRIAEHYQNSKQVYINAYIDEQIEERYKTAQDERKLYKAVYYSSGEQEVFYFQTASNPFEVAENYLPSEWHGLAIEESDLIE